MGVLKTFDGNGFYLFLLRANAPMRLRVRDTASTGAQNALRKHTMVRDFTSKDEGKRVVSSDGDMIGTVESTSGSTAHIKTNADLPQNTRRRLGLAEEGEETYRLQKSKVDRIVDGEIRLKKNL